MPKYILKLIEHYEHEDDIECYTEEYIISENFKKNLEQAISMKHIIYIEATPEQCENLKLEHLSWNFEQNCLITENMDNLTVEAASIGCRVTFDDKGELKILIPITEQIKIGDDQDLAELRNDNSNKEIDKLKESFKALLNDDDVRAHFSKYIANLIAAYVNNAELVSKDDLQKLGTV